MVLSGPGRRAAVDEEQAVRIALSGGRERARTASPATEPPFVNRRGNCRDDSEATGAGNRKFDWLTDASGMRNGLARKLVNFPFLAGRNECETG